MQPGLDDGGPREVFSITKHIQTEPQHQWNPIIHVTVYRNISPDSPSSLGGSLDVHAFGSRDLVKP